MSSSDRRPHETAIVIDQEFLDYSQDNLEQKLQTIAEIESIQADQEKYSCSISSPDSPALILCENHVFIEGDPIIFTTSGNLPLPLIAGTTYYARIINHNSFNVSATPIGGLIATTGTQTGIHEAAYGIGIIRVSDRNIFVGNRFFGARTLFPLVTRTLGEWLRPTIEFSSIQITLNNVDGIYNKILPGGENYGGFINKSINIKMGLRDVEATYFNIFQGFISSTGGFKRDIKQIKFIARDKFDSINVSFPPEKFTTAQYPKIDSSTINSTVPLIYGNYRESVNVEGNIPTITVNKRDPEIYFDKELPVAVLNGAPSQFTIENHNFDNNDKIRFSTDDTLPSPLNDSTDYYVRNPTIHTFNVSTSSGGGSLVTSGGIGQHNVIAQTLRNVQSVISINANTFFDTSEVWLQRQDAFYKISSSDIQNVSGDLNYFEVRQNTGNTVIDSENYKFEESDIFIVKIVGYDLGLYNSNIVSQAQWLMQEFSNLEYADFDQTNWDFYRLKGSPAQSAIANIKSRIYINEEKNLLEFSLSLLEQVRLEYAISRDLKIKINAMHFEDWDYNPSFRIRNFDVEKDSTKVSIDDKTNFNRAGGFYDYNPSIGENEKATKVHKNQNSIDQIDKEISKAIEFPNLYIESDVVYQLKEILKLASGYSELIDLNLTTRGILLDLGDFVKMDVKIGSTVWEDVPMMVRSIGNDPKMMLPIKLWSMQMIPFANPGGWDPGYEGITGGDLATIIEE